MEAAVETIGQLRFCSSGSGVGSCFTCSALRPTRLRFTFQLMQLHSFMRTNLHGGFYAYLSRPPLMSINNGYSSIQCIGLCKICWSIEADIGDSQLIFLTGDLASLGCWNPDMAVIMSPSSEFTYLWYAEIEVPNGSHFKYNYFLKNKRSLDDDLLWRPGPEFSLSVPLENEEREEILVRDSWMRTRLGRFPVPSWGSWMLDMELPVAHDHHISDLHGTTTGGEQELWANSNESLSVGKQLSVCYTSKHIMPKEKDVAVTSSSVEEASLVRDQPIEEPWLLQSILPAMVEFNKLEFASQQETSYKIESLVNLSNETEKLVADENRISYSEKSPCTVILINSSLCTMQRIAVLEDGKLVELLLEPVKDNVRCDSIYLGSVTKFVPHMGGAFVDIGISRPSLMDIKQNREPFVFPLFEQQIKEESAGSFVSADNNKQMNINENGQCFDDEDSIDNILEVDHENAYSRDDFEDLETDDEVDIVDVPVNMNVANDFADNEDYFEEFEDANENYFQDNPAEETKESNFLLPIQTSDKSDNSKPADNKWANVCKGTKVIVQVVKEGLGTKGPALSAYPKLKSRFWVLTTRCDRIGVSKKITGIERARMRAIAKTLQPAGFGLTVRTVAVGHSLEELHKDLDGLLATWKSIIEHAKSAALAAEEGIEGAVPVMLHKAMAQTLSVVQDYFNEKVESLVVDSARTYHEVTSYLHEIAPDLCQRVRLYDKRTPIFDEYNIEGEINNILSKRVPLSNGGSLVIEQTEALVSVDVNGGHGMLGQGTSSQEKAVLEVNLAAARQISRELRLRDIGGIIVVDFIDMADESNKRLVYEEMKKAVERDHSMVKVSELSKHGLMEITRKRVRPSVSFMISEPCSCCHATGRVEALETSFSKIEHEICKLLAALDHKPDPHNVKSWPQFVLRVDRFMCNYLTSGKRTKLAVLSSALKVWILLKVVRGFSRGTFEVKPFTDEKENGGQRVAISRLRHNTEATSYIPNAEVTLFPVKKWKERLK